MNKDKPIKIFKLIDNTKVSTLCFIFIILIIACAFYYFFFSPFGHGIKVSCNSSDKIEFIDALYFSIVTISSLGYGDYSPSGWGRLVAVFEVLSGLIMLSLLVAKLASERQSILIKLIYSSDHERRIKQFRIDLIDYCEKVKLSLPDPFDEKTSLSTLSELNDFLGGLWSYFGFQVHRGMLAEVSAFGNLRGLFRSLLDLQTEIINVAKISRPCIRKYFSRSLFTITRISRIYSLESNDERIHHLYYEMKRREDCYNKLLEKSEDANCKPLINTSELTQSLLRLVQEATPEQPWPKNVHKDVAKKIMITNKLSHKAISELIRQGIFKTQEPEL